MGNGVCAFLFGNLYQAFADDGARKGGAQQVFAFVDRARLHGGDDVFVDKFIRQIFDIQFGGAGFEGFFLQPAELCALAHIRGHGNDLAAIVFLEPRDDDGGIQPAGIGENDFVILFHDVLNSPFYGCRKRRNCLKCL